jgi:uncharacterized protein
MRENRGRVKRGARRLFALALGTLLAGAAAAGAVPTVGQGRAPQDSRPALWLVQDQDTTIYLFGTFHALDGQRPWFDRHLRQAFDSSDELVLETLVPEDPAELRAIFARQGLAAPAAGGERPIDSSTGQAMAAGKSVGMSVDKGADAVLRRAAQYSGKPVGGLERFEDQLSMYRSLPAASQQPVTRQAGSVGASASDPVATAAAALQRMQEEWVRGDTRSFDALISGINSQSPATYRILFANRNAAWASWIEQRMKSPGVVFMAVGTGHLVGRDSVQRNLWLRGIGAARIG